MALDHPSLSSSPRATEPATGKAEVLRDSAVLTSAWVATRVISVAGVRRVALLCAYNAHASASAARAQIRVMLSNELDTDGSNPDVADDVWYEPVIVDASPTATVLTGTKETGATMTPASSEHAVVVARPLAITLGDTTDAGTDRYRLRIVVDVTDAQFLYVAAKELGDTTNLGTLGIKVAVSL